MRPVAQSHLRFPLTRLFGSGGNIRVLRALFSYGAPLSLSQLSRESGLTPPGVRLVLESLETQGILVALGEPRTRLYDLNPRYPFMHVLRQLLAEEKLRWEQVLKTLRKVARENKAVSAAWYYGSVARGEDGPASDLDVAIVVRGEDVEKSLEDVREALRPAEETLFFNCSVIGLSEQDVSRLSRDNDRWWVELVRDGKALKGARPEQMALEMGLVPQGV
jgi:predicted nucleotidyltransferase